MSISELAAEHLETMPGINENAIEPDHETAESETIMDSIGTVFDPDNHASNADGTPKTTKTGRFAKKRGRKPGVTNTTPKVSTLGETSKPRENPNNSMALGRATAETIFALGQMVGGDEWRPIYDEKHGIDERGQMVSAWAAYYDATGKTDLPPWLGVSVAMISYAGPRFRMPKTQTRFQRAWYWFKGKYLGRRTIQEPEPKA